VNRLLLSSLIEHDQLNVTPHWKLVLNFFLYTRYFLPRLPRLIRVEASNTAGRVHQLQAFFSVPERAPLYICLFGCLTAYKSHFKKNRNLYVTYTTSKSRLLIEK
jgi:hypothetical protein